MTERRSTYIALIAIACIFVAGCAGGALQRARYLDATQNIDAAIAEYTRAIHADSTQAAPYFERGYLRYRKGQFDAALSDFRQAERHNNREPAYYLYYALSADSLHMVDSALAGYGEFVSRHSKGEIADRSRARIAALTRLKLKAEIDAAIAREDTLTAVPGRKVVAVLAPDVTAMPERYKPLALALADFAATDLKQVNSLTIVERRKIDALEQELNLSKSGLVDPATAPRTGRLLGAGTLLGGRLSLTSDSSLRYDGVAFSLSGASSALPVSDRLHAFLNLEKSMVFAFLDTLGVPITRAERDAIGKPPTENFLAILAYAQGLEEQRNGDWGAARSSFNHAAQLDPSFSAAREHAVEARANAAGGSVSTAAAAQTVRQNQKYRRPLLRRLTRFGPPPGDRDLPYTLPEGVTRTVLIEIPVGLQ